MAQNGQICLSASNGVMQLSTHCTSEDNILCCQGFDAVEFWCWDHLGNGIYPLWILLLLRKKTLFSQEELGLILMGQWSKGKT